MLFPPFWIKAGARCRFASLEDPNAGGASPLPRVKYPGSLEKGAILKSRAKEARRSCCGITIPEHGQQLQAMALMRKSGPEKVNPRERQFEKTAITTLRSKPLLPSEASLHIHAVRTFLAQISVPCESKAGLKLRPPDGRVLGAKVALLGCSPS